MVQLELVSGNRHLVAWVRDDRRLGVGTAISLRDHPEPTRLWTVRAVGAPTTATAIKRGWNNDI
ncbi:hypothetical protein ACWDV4_13005 [Micromonospora sp. NPDC003197]